MTVSIAVIERVCFICFMATRLCAAHKGLCYGRSNHLKHTLIEQPWE